MQDEFTVYGSMIHVVPLKGWKSAKYLETTLTNQNSIQEEIKSRLKSRECLLSFGAESFVFQFAIQTFKD